MPSHAAGGEDVSDNLLSQMARQVGLKRAELLNVIDCPMSREELDARVLGEDEAEAV